MNVNEILNQLNARKMGSYFSCTCPKCGHHEAFVYISDINAYLEDSKKRIPIRCNRMEKCGQVTYMDELGLDDSQQSVTPVAPIQSESRVEMTDDAIRALDCFFAMPPMVGHSCPVSSYRGLSAKTLKNYGVVFGSGACRTFVDMITSTEKAKQEFYGRKYTTRNYQERDVFLPIYDEDGKLSRILLRTSDKTVKQDKKEIQVIIREGKPEIWNLHDLLDESKPVVFITEGAYDAMSIAQALDDDSVGVVSLPGVRKYRQVLRMVESHPEIASKTFVLAFDNDVAGNKVVAKAMKAFRDKELDVRRYLPEAKDCNDALQQDADAFRNSLEAFLHGDGETVVKTGHGHPVIKAGQKPQRPSIKAEQKRPAVKAEKQQPAVKAGKQQPAVKAGKQHPVIKAELKPQRPSIKTEQKQSAVKLKNRSSVHLNIKKERSENNAAHKG